MIREGKTQGWLVAPASSIGLLGASCGVDFGPCNITSIEGKGAALVANQSVANGPDEEKMLVSVPREIVLSKETILLYAKSDKHLRDLLDAVGEWAQVRAFQ